VPLPTGSYGTPSHGAEGRIDQERTLVIPPPAPEITPEVAHRWLRERLGAYIELTSAGALAENRDTREALHFLVLDVRRIAEACIRAVVFREPFRLALAPREGDEQDFDHRTEILAAVVGARELIRQRWRDGRDLDAVFDELEGALAERIREA
jgi:hypothetical protein